MVEPTDLPVRPWRATVLVWLVFLVFSVVHAPVPGAGEPHYLSKARHLFDPRWCAGDLFLESGNAHLVFYIAIGWLTQLVSLETTAWIGRAAGFALLAAGWTALCRRLSPGKWVSVGAACIYVALAAAGNFSGEWMLNGIEGKVFAYGFLFLGWAWALDARWMAAGAALGGAVSFHPLVGGWGLLTAISGFAVAGLPASERRGRDLLLGAVLFSMAALPGVLSAVSVLGGEKSRTADYIQVFYRLPHHLDPMTFSGVAALAYLGLLFAWLLIRRVEPAPIWRLDIVATASPSASDRFDARRWWLGCVLASALIAVAGLIIGWGPRPPSAVAIPFFNLRLKLMKFYPFRLADVLVPMAVAFTTAGLAVRWCAGSRPRIAVVAAAFVLILGLGLVGGHETRFHTPVPTARDADWKEVCEWIRRHAPRDAVFLTPRETWAFKWYAERPEFVCFKDCPQDAAGILEWNRRLKLLREWSESEYDNGFSERSVMKLADATGITHVVASDLGPFPIKPLYENGTYRVIAVPVRKPLE